MTTVTYRDAEVDGHVTDVVVVDGHVRRVGPADRPSDTTIDAHGGALLPGLHDHHLHLLAMAAARTSADVAAQVDPAAFDRAIAGLTGEHWHRVVGYHEAHHGPLDRVRLDRLSPTAPVRVQHMTGALWVLNTAALDALSLAERRDDRIERDGVGATGRVFGGDDLVRRPHEGLVDEVVAVAHELADVGVTGVTDMTPSEDAGALAVLAEAVRTPGFPLDVVVTGGLGLDPSWSPELRRGPIKLIVGDHDLPLPDELAAAIADAHRRGRAVACHIASDVALAIALAAWSQAEVRPGDRVEHGSDIPLAAIEELRTLGLIVVTQPAFVRSRGDRYRREIDADRWPELWRCATLLSAGVGVAGSSDAPHGPLDPWRAMATAVDRRTASGQTLGPHERVPAARALDLYLGDADDPTNPRRVVVGQPARLCLLDRPRRAALDDLDAVAVVGTHGPAGWRPTVTRRRARP